MDTEVLGEVDGPGFPDSGDQLDQPYRIASEIYAGSDPERKRFAGSANRGRPLLVVSWWLSFLLAGILWRASSAGVIYHVDEACVSETQIQYVSAMRGAIFWQKGGIAGNIIGIAAAGLAVTMIRRVRRNQRQKVNDRSQPVFRNLNGEEIEGPVRYDPKS